MPQEPLISIVIITKNQKFFLKRILDLLQKQSYKSFETIIVDSGSTDSSLDLYQNYPHKLIQIRPKKFNYAYALNKGAKKARGKIILRLSGDAVPGNKYFLQNIKNGFLNNNVAGVCGRYIYSSRMAWDYKILFAYLTKFKQTKIFNHNFPITGACFAFKKSLWQKHAFDQTYPLGDDGEWNCWALNNGYNMVYEPKVFVYHEHGKKNFFKLLKASYLGIYILLRYIKNYPLLFLRSFKILQN